MEIVHFVFNHCNNLGRSLGFGALEGAIIYASILTYGYLSFKGGKKHD